MRQAQRSSSPVRGTGPAPPRAPQAARPVRYPESDGKPMSETPVHWHAMVDFASPLHGFLKDRPDAYVGSNMLMYYEEGNNKRRVSPDVFVAFGVPKLPERRVWLVWEEGKGPDFVLEVTSRSTRREDEVGKKALYERLEVREYWQFDPLGEYLDPRLRGYVLGADGEYREVALEERDGALCHDSLLGVTLRLEGERLRLFDPKRGEYLLTHAEERQARQAVEAERDRALEAQRIAEARMAELERRLRGE
ncbi:MAG: Uma2 family endonuclease [Gammaproteobacteria bacterium]|nr:Uma2 family endonuclease [Gammaproteobacteria bacterium]MDE0273587.1 Uma2 family endonuclease [Gammaproteobacteria bacterium]